MTKEEILQYIKSELVNEDTEIYLDVDDYKIIVEALEQEPCEDAVSRQAVLNEIKSMPDVYPLWSILIDREILIDNIKDLQPVTPTRKKGHWILLDECANSGYYCSKCHKNVVKEGWGNTVKKIKFCPNCGARMESEE